MDNVCTYFSLIFIRTISKYIAIFVEENFMKCLEICKTKIVHICLCNGINFYNFIPTSRRRQSSENGAKMKSGEMQSSSGGGDWCAVSDDASQSGACAACLCLCVLAPRFGVHHVKGRRREWRFKFSSVSIKKSNFFPAALLAAFF